MATSTIKMFVYITLALLCATLLTAEGKPAEDRNDTPLAQTDNDAPDIDTEEPVDNDADEEIENESENDADVEPDVEGEFNTDVDTADVVLPAVDAGAPNPIGRNGWAGYGQGQAEGQSGSGYLTTQSKASHVGIGFGVVILVIAVVVVSGLAIKRPGSNNQTADIDIE